MIEEVSGLQCRNPGGARASGPAAQFQQEVADFLSDPATHNLKTNPVRIETHASIVVLAGGNAYKIKRAVSYPYLDFSTLEKRRAACEAELSVNRKNAPDIYLDVIPITRAPGNGLSLGGTGDVVEWAVHMRRFDEAATLDHLADSGRLTRNIVDDLAAAVRRSHDSAPVNRSLDPVAQMQNVISQTSDELKERCGGRCAFLPELLSNLQASLDQQSELIRARANQGHVRHCHGDLHLRNIAMINGKPVLFDAIEFDPALATIDTLYDLSFLVMDLCHRRLGPLGCRFLNRYLWETKGEGEEIAGLALLPLFLALRACIRAVVLAAQSELTHTDKLWTDIKAYLADARDFLQPNPTQIVAIGGLSGSGKSSISDLLAPCLGAAPGAVQVRSDIERKRLFGVPALTRLGPEAYSQTASQDVYGVLMELAEAAARAGRCAVVDATFLHGLSRQQIEEMTRHCGASFTGIWLDAPATVLRRRIVSRSADASDATVLVLEKQLQENTAPETWHRIDASESPDGVLRQVLSVMHMTAGAKTL